MHEGHKYEEIVSADDADSLSKRLAMLDRYAIGKGKRIEHIQVCRLLSTLADTNHLSYPLSLKKWKRSDLSPDFLLNCNGQDIGIEATEATHPDYKEYEVYARSNPSEAEKSTNVIALPTIRHGAKLTKKEKNDFHARNELDDGWCGDAPEKDWFLYTKDAIATKCKNLARQDFQKFQQNWLLILANPPMFLLDKEELTPYIKRLWPSDGALCFDRIFIETGWTEEDSVDYRSWLISLSCKKLECFLVENIWRKAS